MEPRILTDAELAKERLFKNEIKALETQFGKPIKAILWKDLQPELLLENGNEPDSSIKDKPTWSKRSVTST